MAAITDQEIRDFLQKIESYLEDLPLHERQAGLLQWQENLQKYYSSFPEQDFTQLKQNLGGPKAVANLIRFQRLHPLQKAPRQLASQALMLIFAFSFFTLSSLIGYLWWKFTPLIKTDDERTLILGGLIEIDRKLGQLKMGDTFDFSETTYSNIFEGSFEVPATTEDITLEFDRGQLEMSFTNDNRIVWNCKVASEPEDGFIKQESELVSISLKGIGGSDCSFKLPSRVKYIVTGDNGKISLIAPPNDIFVQLGNGIVAINPETDLAYRYDFKVGSGTIDPTLSGQSFKDGIEIKVELENGAIQRFR